jgi:HAD superfamily hydrolase (TIGR01490 family)
MNMAAFFDLDGTLLDANSGKLWMNRERRLGRLTPWQTVQGLVYLTAYKTGFIDMEKVTIKALGTVRGEREERLRRWTHAWFEEEVVPYVSIGAWRQVAWHRMQGHKLILLTSSSPYESEAASAFFELDAFLSMRYEVKDGRFTGDVCRPLCYGAGKVIHAESLARRQSIDLAESYFYTDSITDLPMLERVGHPRVVNPDYRLRRKAEQQGWPIYVWTAAGSRQRLGRRTDSQEDQPTPQRKQPHSQEKQR